MAWYQYGKDISDRFQDISVQSSFSSLTGLYTRETIMMEASFFYHASLSRETKLAFSSAAASNCTETFSPV